MEPGHGYKGKQRWITCNEDLQDMYEANCMKKEILLWCFLPDKEGPIGKKRSSDTADSSSFPFFKGKKKKDNERVPESRSSDQSSVPTGSTNAVSEPILAVVEISPGKRINLRTECIQQLHQLGELLDKGNITSQQECIFSDIYKF